MLRNSRSVRVPLTPGKCAGDGADRRGRPSQSVDSSLTWGDCGVLSEAWVNAPALPGRAAASEEGGPGCRAGVSQRPESRFQERAVSPGPASPSSSPSRPRGASDYISSPHLSVRGRLGTCRSGSASTPSTCSFRITPVPS